MQDHLPIVIELVFVMLAVALFAWWQLHEIKVDRRKIEDQRAAMTREAQRRGAAVAHPPPDGVLNDAGAAAAADPPATSAPDPLAANKAAATNPPGHVPHAHRVD